MKKIVIIDNYDSFTYNLSHLVKELGAEVTVYRNDQFEMSQLKVFDKIILSPGPGIPSEAGLLLDVIKTYAGRKPILGVCLGHQAIGEVFGGTLTNLSDVYHGVATPVTITADDYLFEGLGKTFEVGRYHSWVVDTKGFPDCLEVTSVSEEGFIMSLRHREYDIRGIQYHPESVLTPGGKTIIKNWLVNITRQAYPAEQIAALLMAMQTRGATVDEMLGFRDGLLETGKHVNLDDFDTLDIVGTGGDGKNTFNISTCACFVVAGAGFKVSKHGNGASTSVSGASNVLMAHGVKFSDNEDVLRRSIEKAGICYLHAPLFATGMKFVGPVRKALSVPTCFNLLGPFINPCTPKNSLHGTATPTQLRLYSSMHQRIGDNFGVISSYDGYDEISLTSGFKFVTRHFEKVYTPLEMGLAYVKPEEIFGGTTGEEAKRIFDDVLENKATRAQTEVVIANAACGISLMNPNLPISDTVAMARESIESGKALQCLKAFIEINS